MSIKTIKYEIDIAGITPATEQFCGTQGDHRVTKIEFALTDELYATATSEINSKTMYRFDVYDGEGGIWQSEPTELIGQNVNFMLEERHTRHGGKITVYLVITSLSEDNETEIELYTFPAVLRLKNRPEGVYQDGEDYESVTALAQTVKQNAHDSSMSLVRSQKIEADITALVRVTEEKLKNGEFDGVGVESAQIVNDELIIIYTDNTVQNLGNVKGAQGPRGEIGPQGEKGENGKDAAIDQTYNAESENAQSGQAVAEAVSDKISKPQPDGTPNRTAIVFHNQSGAISTVYIDDGSVVPKTYTQIAKNMIATRDSKGNLWTGTPIDNEDCANKEYIDNKLFLLDDMSADIAILYDMVGNVETLLGGI